MRAAIDRDHLRDGLKTVSGAVPPRSTLPVLGMVLLSTEEGRLRLTGTNLEMALTTTCDCHVEEEGSLVSWFWPRAVVSGDAPLRTGDIPAETSESRALSRELKRRGFRFVGPTIMYAFMQAVGLVDDHAAGCLVRPAVEADRQPVLLRYGGPPADG